MKNRVLLTGLCATALAAGTAEAALTYVDATQANTTSSATIPTGTGGPAAQAGWRERTGFANGGAIFAANGDNDTASETTPELTTTISLADGTYEMYVVFWSAGYNETTGAGPGTGNNQWDVAAGLTSGSLAEFVVGDGGGGASLSALDGSDFAGSVLTFEGNRRVWFGSLGQTVVSGGSVSVFINDIPNDSANGRTWYDGVAYEAIPEPGSLALLGLGGLALLRRRRG